MDFYKSLASRLLRELIGCSLNYTLYINYILKYKTVIPSIVNNHS